MAEKPSNSDRYKLPIPQPLQDAVDEIALNSPLVTETQADLDDYKKRWLVVGICIHSVIAPALRNYICPILTVLYDELNRSNKIETQIYPTHLQQYPRTHAVLNYEAVNNNKGLYRYQKAKWDYTIKNAVELSKLFQPTHMAHYTGFDETCETSGLLELVINIDKFAPDVRSDAVEVRRRLRNPWAHCNFSEWDAAKYSNAFVLMEQFVLDMNLSSNEKNQTIGKLKKWEINGEQFLSGTTVGIELVNELRQQTCVLGEYVRQIATGTDCNFTKINNELEKIQILLINSIDQLQKDMEEIDKRVKAQDKIIENQHTQLADFNTNLNKCACHDSHNVKIELWREQEVMFVETPVVKDILQILESKHSVLIVGEPGIGKSMLMHHIALKLHSTMNYIIIPCSAINDIIKHYQEGIHQMFILDDICGRFTASLSEIEYLQKQKETFNRMLKKGKTKIAATCRLDIYSGEYFHVECTFFTSNIINLSEEYSKENKLQICAKYLTETNIQLLKDKNEVFTPLMCYLYSKNENFNLTDFLHCPYETYQNEWEQLQSIDPYKYCALFLCVLRNGSVNGSLFDIYTENLSSKNFVFQNIFEICGLNRGTSRCKMETVFDSIIGTYVRKKSNEYSVIHDQMFDFMCGYFGNKDTMVRCILHDACIQILNERTQLESINEQRRKFTILITHRYEHEYFERISNEIKLGNLEECSRNPQMNNDTYRASFIEVLKSIDDKFIFEEIHSGTFSKKCNVSYLEFLITSCKRGYYDIVEFYVSKGADLENSVSFYTPLTAACEGGNEKIVQLLIDKGCNKNKIDFSGQTPLTAACERGHENIVQLLIDRGCTINHVDGMIQTPMTAACERGHEKIVQLLKDKGCNINQADGMGQTPLTAACSGGYEKIVHLLIDKGCNIKQPDGIGQTPLIAACGRGHENIVHFLIDKGCDINQVDDMGETPLTAACSGGYENILHFLIDKGCDIHQVDFMIPTPLTAACRGGHENILHFLIDKGCDINQADDIRQTPLTAACEGGHENILHLLIDKGCIINQVGDMEQSPLTAACSGGYEKIVHLLIDRGCDIHQVGDMIQTPMTAACSGGYEKIVHLLIDKGCNINQADGMRQTPLTAACRGGHENILHLLINKGCIINQVGDMGQSPLTAACSGGYEKIVHCLIDNGCHVNQADGKGQTPLTAAYERGNEKIVQLLIAKGFNINQVDGMRQTPLTAACDGGNEKIVQQLIDRGYNVNQADGKGADTSDICL